MVKKRKGGGKKFLIKGGKNLIFSPLWLGDFKKLGFEILFSFGIFWLILKKKKNEIAGFSF